MGRALQPAPAGIPAAFSYERRRPEETTLYQVVQEQLETFLAQVEAKTGAGLPAFVKHEFEAFLECGILEEQGMTYMADIDPANPLRSLQAASCTYRIAFGPRAGQQVLTFQVLRRASLQTKTRTARRGA